MRYRYLILLISLIFFSKSVCAEQLKFVQITDNHLSQNGSNYQGRNIRESVQILKNAVKSVNNLKDIDFVVFSGDNIDTPNEEDLNLFCKIIKKLRKPYYIVIGDHDVSPHGRLNKSKYFKIIKKQDKHQKSSEPQYYFSPDKNFIVIAMDGVLDGIRSPHGYYSEEDLAWLDEVLTKYKKKKAIIFQHFPLIAPYKNKSHTTIEPEAYFDLLSRHKNVIAILSGHYHGGNKIVLQDGIYHISTPALVNAPYNYRVIEINYDKKILFSNTPKFDLETRIIQVKSQ